MDKVDLENTKAELYTLLSLFREGLKTETDPTEPVEYLHRLLSERYAAGWDDAMESVGSRLATPAPRSTKFREVRAR